MKMLFGLYVLIGMAMTALMFLDEEVRREAAEWEPIDFVGFLMWNVLTWPEIIYAAIVGV